MAKAKITSGMFSNRTDALVLGAPLNQHALNQQIESFIHNKDTKAEPYSEADKVYINQYEGSGGQAKEGARGEGLLYEFYTPEYVVELMWELARNYGYSGGPVIEPSCATGRLFAAAPDKRECVGFEINPVSRRIAQINYPEATIHQGYFETAFLNPPRYFSRLPKSQLTWLPQYPFSLAVGNPPYGIHKNLYSSYFPNPKLGTLEIFFIYYALMLLKPGGVLVYLISSNFLRNGNTYNAAKNELGKIAKFTDGYRLPPVFKSSAVPTDIIVLTKK